jgi:sugar lactone lactonase YvrE
MAPITCVAHTADVLGEVPIWSLREQALYWIDAFKPAIHRLDPASGAVASWTPPVKLGSFALRAAGGMLLASRAGLGLYDPATGAFELLCNPEADRPNNLLNDGRCDRRGRFWVGSMDKMIEQPSARLYRFDQDRACRVMAEDIFLTNGIAFSPDDRTLYMADSHHKTIYRYDFDLANGAIANRRVFATPAQGLPDGACVDREGFLWSAQFDAGQVVRYAPDGRLDRTIELPVSRPTACTFGGADLGTLFVTTARLRLSEAERAAQPDAGGLLAIEVGVTGLPEPEFAG